MTKMFVVFAPSGAGKTSLVRGLVAADATLALSVSYTTRAKREGEKNGIDYMFISEDDFASMRAANQFVEHAYVYGNWYGTGRERLESQLQQGNTVLEVDWQGARQISQSMPQTVLIGIQPPTIAEVRARLKKRGKDCDQVIDKRMQTIGEEIRRLAMADYLVINDEFDLALADLRAIVRSHSLEYQSMRQQHQQLLAQLD